MIWFLLALLAGAAVVKSSAPVNKEGDQKDEGGPENAPAGTPLQPMTVPAQSVESSKPLVDQLTIRAANFTAALDSLSGNYAIAKGAQAAGNRAAVNDSLALAGKAWADLSTFQVSFITSLVGDWRGADAGSIERLLILLQNPSTTKIALDALKGVFRSRPGFVEGDWLTLALYLRNAVDAGVPVYIGVNGESVRGYLFGKESSIAPSGSLTSFLNDNFSDVLTGIPQEMGVKALAGVIPVGSLPISTEAKDALSKKIAAMSGDLKNEAIKYAVGLVNPEKLIKTYLPVLPDNLTIPGINYKLPLRQILRVVAGEKMKWPTLAIPGDVETAANAAFPGINDTIASYQAMVPADVRSLIKLYLDFIGAAEGSGGSTYACVPRGFCQLVSAFDQLPADQRIRAFTAFRRMQNHLASHAPVATALGLLAYVSENWALYSPTFGEMLDGSFEKAMGDGLKDTARPARYRQFFTSLVTAIATTTANDYGVPLYAWKHVLDKTIAGWDGGITGARDSGYMWPGASGVAFAYYFAEQASLEVKKQLGL